MQYEVRMTYSVSGARLKKLYAVYEVEGSDAKRVTPFSTAVTAKRKQASLTKRQAETAHEKPETK